MSAGTAGGPPRPEAAPGIDGVIAIRVLLDELA
jgi:hypothetical protein